MDYKQTEHSLLAFYGFPFEQAMIAKAYPICLGLFERFRCTPHLMAGKNGVRNFKAMERALKAGGFSGLKSLEMYSLLEGAKNQLEGCNLEVFLSPQHSISFVSFNSSMLPFGSAPFLDLAAQLIDLLTPSYGIGFAQIHAVGPTYFAMGLGYGNAPREHKDLTRSWGVFIEHQLFLSGFLGGVFPWNLLTKAQLQIVVDGFPLQVWISQESDRGKLRPMPKNMVLWTVANEHLAGVRQALYEAGVVFDYERDVVAKMNEYRRSHQDVIEHLRSGRPLTQGPELPPLKPGGLLGKVLHAFGYESAEDAQVLKVEKPGKANELSTPEVAKSLRKAKRSKGK